ncbi:MAG: ATP-binding cassette domain-containing protein [Chlorobi bacterium]|nr:ATP-binding cassette domain-containing protein [Chlorobiota bacterium]
MIEVVHLSKNFKNQLVLEDVSCRFERGQTNLIIGQSGSGKTVLLKCIVGLLTPTEGDVVYDDTIFTRANFQEKKKIRRQIGMLFQGGALFDSSTVEENVRYPLDMFTEMTEEEKKERVNYCLKRVNIVNSNHLFPSELSGGMKKRVAIARAIVLNPKYLLCDEPNSGLDPQTAIVIDNLIKEITEEFNTTTIVNTHDMNSVMGIGKKVVFIFNGRKEWEGSNKDIFQSDNQALNQFVFANRLAREFKTPEK